MMFLDCPAHLDEDGARRCGLPAEVRCRFTMRSSDGPVEAAMIRCPSGHWFNGTIDSLTWEGEEQYHPAGDALVDARGGTIVRHHPADPWPGIERPSTAPAYYLGRPARLWITAMSPRGRRKPVADTQPGRLSRPTLARTQLASNLPKPS
jgi:hypothetical protein